MISVQAEGSLSFSVMINVFSTATRLSPVQINSPGVSRVLWTQPVPESFLHIFREGKQCTSGQS